MEEEILASSYSPIIDSKTGHSIVGIVYINKNVDYSQENAQEYFQSIIIHEFTHILGFNPDHFYYYLDILKRKDDIYLY